MSTCWESFLNIGPIVLIILLYTYSYYCYTYELIWKMVRPLAKRIIYGIIFNLLLTMTLWCYFATMLTPQDDVPSYFRPPFQIRESIRIASTEEIANQIVTNYCTSRNIILKTRNSRGYIRYCHYCKNVKPDRAHHCSNCEICILKMDHHCPWVAACIGYTNYKKFLLFLFYTSLYLLFASTTSIEYCIEFFYIPHEDRDYAAIQIVICCLVALLIAVTVLVFLIYHLTLLFTNKTTLESMTEPIFANNEELTFNIDLNYNFCDVFGYDVGYWFIPIGSSPGNGYTFYTIRK